MIKRFLKRCLVSPLFFVFSSFVYLAFILDVTIWIFRGGRRYLVAEWVLDDLLEDKIKADSLVEWAEK